MSDTNFSAQFGEPQATLLQPMQMLPAFTLPGPDGMPHSPWDYKQREHLVLLVTRSVKSSETRGLLRAFADAYLAFREEYCAILAISPNTVLANLEAQEKLHLPFPLLADPKGEVISRYTAWNDGTPTPCIVLADRYNEIRQVWATEREADLPAIEDLLEWLRYINRLCVP
jgi:peroxiredoxin